MNAAISQSTFGTCMKLTEQLHFIVVKLKAYTKNDEYDELLQQINLQVQFLTESHIEYLKHQDELKSISIKQTQALNQIMDKILNEKLYIGGVYSPPKTLPPFELFEKHKDKDIYLFGDYNAKHSNWNYENSNFLSALSDRCSVYESIKLFRPPWPLYLVNLIREVNKLKRKWRRTRFLGDYLNFKHHQKIYIEEKVKFEQNKREQKIKHIKEDNNVWSHIKQVFRPYTPSFRGLTTNGGVLKGNQEIADQLANYYEKHFSEPVFDVNNTFHLECIESYEKIKNTQNISLGKIKLEEVVLQWKIFFQRNEIVARIEKWCTDQSIHIDEQSGLQQEKDYRQELFL
ncbi:unnamed protein product [Didymodactylos carnosus]|uniref:Endonuclease/exonuclease/phosphatase domain-containing protein n=1 Tax=Didymodactylos carnosus TaxID=1234261 RepID=A0A814U3C1_9BILA|nr:unnamed protein product [Didymodactylos carnosus]CAF3934723.1 unnamed protein product [Didymodactylos carnosus]